jgi:hypothetical protein
MLRESSLAFGYDLNLGALVDDTIDPGVPLGREIIDFVVAVQEGTDVGQARESLAYAAGAEGLVDTAAVFGNFEMMNRLAEGTGIPYPRQAVEREWDLVEILHLESLAGT